MGARRSRRSVVKFMSAAPLVLAGIASARVRAQGAGEMKTIADVALAADAYRTETVKFSSHGVSLAGTLFVPIDTTTPPPCVVILGPFGYVKEMSPMEYATRLARAGFAALIFDPRFSGESGGTPRRLESPAAKIADVGAAIEFLMKRSDLATDKLAALGICQGSSEMIAVAASDPRVKVLATVSGQYLYRENLEGFFGGGGPTLDERIARGRKAKAAFEASGVVDYTAVVDPTDKAAGLPWPPINAWYQPWTTPKWGEPSRWENRYATMSDAEVWSFDVDKHAARIKVPTLLIHGEQSDGQVAAVTHVFERIPAADKHMEVIAGVFHTRFYDDPLVIEPAAARVAAWFKSHLN
jgi:pimeloyl-ACP methyl ester carboxylesterase